METMWDYSVRVINEDLILPDDLQGVVVDDCGNCGMLLTIQVFDFNKGPFYCSIFCLEQHRSKG